MSLAPLSAERLAAHTAAVTILLQHGVDVREVLTHGLSHEGYQRLVTRKDGTIDIHNGDAPPTETVSWPEGFPAAEFIGLLHEYVGAAL